MTWNQLNKRGVSLIKMPYINVQIIVKIKKTKNGKIFHINFLEGLIL